MMTFKTILSTLSASIISFNCTAFDLSNAYELALKHDIQFQIERSNLLATKATLPQAHAAFKPQFSVQAQGRYFDSDNSDSASFSNTSINGNLNYTQVIYNQQNSASIGAAKASLAQARIAVNAAQEDLIIRTSEAYFGILSAQDNLEFALIEQQAIARQLEQAEKRFEVGLTAITDVKEAEARYDTSVAQTLAAQNQLDINQQSLELITGPIQAASMNSLDPSLVPQRPQPASSQYWVDLAMQNNATVKSAQANLRLLAAHRKRAAGADNATVSAAASYGVTPSDHSMSGNNTANDFSLAITLNVPLYTGGLNAALLAEQEARYQSAKDTVLLQKRIAARQASSLYLTIISGISQIKALKQASNSSQTALDATNAGFEVGTRTSVDVLTSINETFRSKRDELRARYDYLLNILRLKQAAGRLTVDDIISINLYILN